MANYKALQIIRTFTKEEMKEFEKFLASPYFSTGRDLMPLFTYLKKYHPEYKNEKALELDAVHKALSVKGKKTGADTTRKLLSDLYKQAEEFVLISSLKNNKYFEFLLKLKRFEEKRLYTLFDKTYLLAQEYLSKSNSKTEELFWSSRELLDLKISMHYEKGEQNKTNELLIQNIKNTINGFYFSIVANLQFIQTNKESFENEKKTDKPDSIDKILSYFNFKDFASEHSDPRVKIYHIIFETTNGILNRDLILKFKRLLSENRALFGQFELYELYKSLAAMCINLNTLTRNTLESNTLLFETYKDIADFGALINPQTEAIDLLRFRNIFNTALNVREVNWAENFISVYSGYLPAEHRKDIENLTKAMLEYHKKNCSAALDHINKVNQSKFVFINDLKFLQLKCYYDLGFFENADALFSSYRRYINYSSTVPEEFKTYILAFLKQYEALFKLKIGFDEDVFDQLMAEVKELKSSWIHKKLIALKKD